MNNNEILNEIINEIRTTINNVEYSFNEADNMKQYIELTMDRIVKHTENNNLRFYIIGHPLNIDVIDKYIDWKIKQGDKICDIELDYGYGELKDTKFNCSVISTTKIDVGQELKLSTVPIEPHRYRTYSFNIKIE